MNAQPIRLLIQTLTIGLLALSVSGVSAGDMAGAAPAVLDARNVTLEVRAVDKTMSDGEKVRFWLFCPKNGDSMGDCTLPGPVLQLGVGQKASITLNINDMTPQEAVPYDGHTIHPHGLDVPQLEDGVPETGAPVDGDNYAFTVDSRYVGGHMYHCHQHTVKHLEMGMYGAFVVKAVDANGNLLNVINQGGPAYDYEWNWVLSAVDPAYHADTAVGDSTVFADYNPKYFLVNGKEGLSKSAPAETLTAALGKKVAIRLTGLHSVNSVFKILDADGKAKSFTVHNLDGFKLPTPKTVTSLEVAPGQTKDVLVSLPTSGAGPWYPQVSYTDLRKSQTYRNGTVYARIDF